MFVMQKLQIYVVAEAAVGLEPLQEALPKNWRRKKRQWGAGGEEEAAAAPLVLIIASLLNLWYVG
jgi:hypothetical protein